MEKSNDETGRNEKKISLNITSGQDKFNIYGGELLILLSNKKGKNEKRREADLGQFIKI